jgi:glycosyltransferase involved in cell wall biosynthesis
MRILYVIPGLAEGFSQIFSKRQAEALRYCGVSVDLVFIPIWSSFHVPYRGFHSIKQAIERTKPDIVHAQYGTQTGAMCAFGTRKKMIVTFRGSDLNPVRYANPIRMTLGYLLSQLAALRAARVICVSNELKERLWRAQDRVEIIPSPIDLELFHPVPREKAREVLGWDLHEKVVLFNAGRCPIEKGLHIVQRAIKVVRKRIGNVRLEVVSGNVPPDRMPLFHNASDCLVLASAYEGSPNMVKEALACNLPIVTTKVGDVEIRLKGVTFSRIINRNPQEIGKAIADILSDGRRSNGSEKVTELSLEATTRRLIGIYTDVIGNRG